VDGTLVDGAEIGKPVGSSVLGDCVVGLSVRVAAAHSHTLVFE
jgi:hypothetical protein